MSFSRFPQGGTAAWKIPEYEEHLRRWGRLFRLCNRLQAATNENQLDAKRKLTFSRQYYTAPRGVLTASPVRKKEGGHYKINNHFYWDLNSAKRQHEHILLSFAAFQTTGNDVDLFFYLGKKFHKKFGGPALWTKIRRNKVSGILFVM